MWTTFNCKIYIFPVSLCSFNYLNKLIKITLSKILGKRKLNNAFSISEKCTGWNCERDDANTIHFVPLDRYFSVITSFVNHANIRHVVVFDLYCIHWYFFQKNTRVVTFVIPIPTYG